MSHEFCNLGLNKFLSLEREMHERTENDGVFTRFPTIFCFICSDHSGLKSNFESSSLIILFNMKLFTWYFPEVFSWQPLWNVELNRTCSCSTNILASIMHHQEELWVFIKLQKQQLYSDTDTEPDWCAETIEPIKGNEQTFWCRTGFWRSGFWRPGFWRPGFGVGFSHLWEIKPCQELTAQNLVGPKMD